MNRYTVKIKDSTVQYHCLMSNLGVLATLTTGMVVYTDDDYCRWFPMHMVEYVNIGSHKDD